MFCRKEALSACERKREFLIRLNKAIRQISGTKIIVNVTGRFLGNLADILCINSDTAGVPAAIVFVSVFVVS